MSHHHHAIDYVELSASHLAAARAFYSAAFGWTFNDYGPEYAGIQGSDPPAKWMTGCETATLHRRATSDARGSESCKLDRLQLV